MCCDAIRGSPRGCATNPVDARVSFLLRREPFFSRGGVVFADRRPRPLVRVLAPLGVCSTFDYSRDQSKIPTRSHPITRRRRRSLRRTRRTRGRFGERLSPGTDRRRSHPPSCRLAVRAKHRESLADGSRREHHAGVGGELGADDHRGAQGTRRAAQEAERGGDGGRVGSGRRRSVAFFRGFLD